MSPAPLGWVLRLLALLGVVWLGCDVFYVFLGSNFHVVIDQRCFRAGQPTPARFKHWVRTHGIRTVINLRGENADHTWYKAEVETLRDLDVELLNTPITGICRNPEHQLRTLVDAIEKAREPVLIHCYQGIDRTGFAAAAYLLIRTDTPLETARRQLHIRYGHFAIGRCRCLDQALDEYQEWLERYGSKHSPEFFCRWVRDEYRM